MNYRAHITALFLFAALGSTGPVAAWPRQDVPPDNAGLRLIKSQNSERPGDSGDGQAGTVRTRLRNPLRVRVLDAGGRPVVHQPVYFAVAAAPRGAQGQTIGPQVVYTDSSGFATARATLGSRSGSYTFIAKIQATTVDGNSQIFQATANPSDWLFSLFIGLAGGLGLFLYGMHLMSEGLKKSAGDRMRAILGALTQNRVVAVGVGAFVTMIMQSSSATTVMLVSFVQAQLMTFSQSLGIILGADIGTTVTAQLIAFKLTDSALLFVGIGVGMRYIAKQEKLKTIGESLIGFGLLFFGMHVMSEAMVPLRSYEPFLHLLISLENPLLGIGVGALFTALIQSSGAFAGILIVLAAQGLLSLEAGIPLLFGGNIGTCITAALASVSANREAKRVAFAHTAFKVFGVLLFIAWIPEFANIVRAISPRGAAGLSGVALLADVVPRQIANAHTIFNVALAIVVLPFTGQAARLIEKLLPDIPERRVQKYQPRYLDDSLIATPSLALSVARAEILRMGEIAKKMVERVLEPFIYRKAGVLREIEKMEEEEDYLEDRINDFLTRITQQSVPERLVDEAFQMMYTVIEFEQIADIVVKNLCPRAREWLSSDAQFSEIGRAEIVDYHLRTVKQLGRALETFKGADLQKARRMKRKYKKYRAMEESFLRTHFERLREDIPETKTSTEVHQDLMELFRRISSHATNIARILLEWREAPEGSEAGGGSEST